MLSSAAVQTEDIRRVVDQHWEASILPTLEQYIRIPNQSPLFDPDWKRNGHMHQAVRDLGATLPSPFMAMSFLALSVIPELKITDRGLVDTVRFELVPLEV